MNKESDATSEGNTKNSNSGKVTENFIDYYEKMYENLGQKIQEICKRISDIPQYRSKEKDPELELRKLISETTQHRSEVENPELQELAQEAGKLMKKQDQIEKIIYRLRFPPDQE